MKTIKVLFVTNEAKTYGSNRSMLNLIDSLKKYNIEFFVLIPELGPLEEELKLRNINYKKIKYYSWIKPIGKKDLKIKQTIKMFFNQISAYIFCFWVRKQKFEIIHSINSAVCFGSFLSKCSKIKHVWHIREFLEEDHNYEFYNKNYAIKLINNSNKIICVSNAVLNKYKDLLDTTKMSLIYNGVPLSKSNNLLEKPKIFKILIAGSITKTKGQEEAIKAVEFLVNKNIKNIELLIAGRGDYEEYLKDYVTKHKLDKNVKFLGFVNNLNEVRCDINISLVCSRNEAFGRVTIESMMAKNLVIGSNTGGTLELVKNEETGFLYSQGNYMDLASKIESAINNWDNSKKIIDVAYKYAIDNFSIEKCAEQVYSVYEEIK